MKLPELPLTEPTEYGYLYLGMRIDSPRRVPFVRPSAERDAAIAACKDAARRLEEIPEVIDAEVYRATLIPPLKTSPRFDVMMLVKTVSPEAATRVRDFAPCRDLNADFVMAARNIRRIGDTDGTRDAHFLFNHFPGPDTESAVKAWESFASWYVVKMNVDNTTLLGPLETGPYAMVNQLRLPRGPVRYLLGQFRRPSFYSVVLKALRENGMGSLPVLCRPA
ncbi:MAG: hypothetical protein ACRDXX_16595 [Stackebrandtia sp.]